MVEKEIAKWNEFAPTIDEIRDTYGKRTVGQDFVIKNRVLFRGQANSDWSLVTTLERASRQRWSVDRYAKLTLLCAPHIAAFTGEFRNLPSMQDAEKEIQERFSKLSADIPQDIYNFWIYLRHHGFPSPLLDWTLSPYIAAAFCFIEKPIGEKVSVFAYIEHPLGTKGGRLGAPQIQTMNAHVIAHKRHFIQQCFYTIATKPEDDEHYFVCHEDIFSTGSGRQDILVKITMPASERNSALKFLNDANINLFSLFQTEDALVRSLALRELDMNL